MTLSISKRLEFISTLINEKKLFADIGSDHAYLPCYICLQDEEARAIAGEVVQGPYNSAVETVRKHQLEDRIDVRLGSGLTVLNEEDEVSDIVIAGMGGTLISQILLSDTQTLQRVERLILQPNNNEHKVRQTCIQIGYVLTAEYILEENGLIYEILVAERKEITNEIEPYDLINKEKQLLFGPFLSKEKSDIFIKKWNKEHQKLRKTIKQMQQSDNELVHKKINTFKQKISWIEEVIS